MRTSIPVLALVLAVGVADSGLAQRPGLPSRARGPTSSFSTILEVRVYNMTASGDMAGGLGEILVCVGDQDDPRRYGEALSNTNGIARFQGVPISTDLIVTASRHGSFPKRRGERVEFRMRGRFGALDIGLQYGRGGPTCSTPGRRKALPEGADPRPVLKRPLRTESSVVRQRRVVLYTDRGSPWDYLDVGGNPTRFRTSQDPTFTGVAWRSASTSNGRMHYVTHDIEGGDGTKTIYLQLRNARGTSDSYSVRVNFVDLYSCVLEYERADNALAPQGVPEGNLGVERVTLTRAQSKTFDTSWPSPHEKQRGYGTHLRRASNPGEHAVEITYGSALFWNEVLVHPGQQYQFKADLKAVRCP